MRLTQRRKDLLKRLIDAAKMHYENRVWDSFEDQSELAGAIMVFERELVKPTPNIQWESPLIGEKIMCKCGDPECYHRLTIGLDETLHIDLDASDPIAGGGIEFTLPKKYALMKRKR